MNSTFSFLVFSTASLALAQDQQGTLDPTAPHPKVAPAIKQIDTVVANGPFAPDWASLSEYEIPRWYQDAKFWNAAQKAAAATLKAHGLQVIMSDIRRCRLQPDRLFQLVAS